jgi:hypothetical protein
LLFLGGTAFAGNTPLPKWDNSIGWNYRAHYYMNAPNAQGPNGQGDSHMAQYQGLIDFKNGGLFYTIVGINIQVHDFSGGVNRQTFKAMEMRLENPNQAGCPNWSANGLVAQVTPVPYLSNWASLNQYPFSAPVAYPVGLNTLTTIQYTPGQNILTPGCPLVACDNGVGGIALQGTGRGYFYDGALMSCFGPVIHTCQAEFYGNPPPPPATVAVRIANVWYDTGSDEHSMIQGAGLKMNITLVNNIGMTWGPGALEMYMHEGNRNWIWFSPPGVDLLAALSGGTKTSPLSLRIPATGIAAGVKMTNLFGQLGDYLFNAFTLNTRLSGNPATGSVDQTDVDQWLMNPKGAQDPGYADLYWWFGSGTVWGRGFSKLFNKNHVPQNAFTVVRVDHARQDWNGNGFPLYRADVRTEATTGFGQSNLQPAGLLGTFDRRIVTCCSLNKATAYNTVGSVGISFPIPPTGNFYTDTFTHPGSNGYQMCGDGQGGKDDVPLGESFYNWGGGGRPFGAGTSYHDVNQNYVFRLIMTEPLEGSGWETTARGVANKTPVFAKMRK